MGRDRRPAGRGAADRRRAVRARAGRDPVAGPAVDRRRSRSLLAGALGGLPRRRHRRCRCSRRSTPQPKLLTAALALQALLGLAALVGFGLRYRAHGEDLDRWLAFGATIWLFAELHAVFTPPLSSEYVSQGDFLRLALLRSPARRRLARDPRRRVRPRGRRGARTGRARDPRRPRAVPVRGLDADEHARRRRRRSTRCCPRLQEAAAAAQQEARFAVLALSSAGGTAPFDAALNRYVEFLTADGQLDVDLEIERERRARPGRADRDLPDRPGGPRERPPPRGRPAGDRADRPPRRRAASSGSSTTATASTRTPTEPRPGPPQHPTHARRAIGGGFRLVDEPGRRHGARGRAAQRRLDPTRPHVGLAEQPGGPQLACGLLQLGERASSASSSCGRSLSTRRSSSAISAKPLDESAFSRRSRRSLARICARSARAHPSAWGVSSRSSVSVKLSRRRSPGGVRRGSSRVPLPRGQSLPNIAGVWR